MKKILLAGVLLLGWAVAAQAQERTWGVLDPVLLEKQGYAWEPNFNLCLSGGFGTFGRIDLPDPGRWDIQSPPVQWDLSMRIDSFHGFMLDANGGQYLQRSEYGPTGDRLDMSQDYFGMAAHWVNRNILPRTDLLLGLSWDAFVLHDEDFAGGLGFHGSTIAWSLLLGADYHLSQNVYLMVQGGYRFGKYVRFVLNETDIRWVGDANQDITYDIGGLTLRAGIGLKL